MFSVKSSASIVDRSKCPSRREFLVGAAAGVIAAGVRGSARQTPTLTAARIVDRIREHVAVAWRDTAIDGFKVGSPDATVTGIATAVVATADVLRRAAAGGRNLVIVQEPTFYTAAEDGGNRAADAVYLAKKALVDEAHLVVWRFSEHWNARKPNESVAALANALGWGAYRQPDGDAIYRIPETRLDALLEHVRTRLHIRGGLRWIGRPDMPVRTALLSPGTTDLPSTVARMPRADVLIAGEPREWEAVPYVLDAGAQKAIISVGRIVSLEPGARACAAWIRSFTPEFAVEAIAVGDPYWSAAFAPPASAPKARP
jgi:putative NIF3 family GTP cyclohydrolase 1 type 2